MNKEDLQRMREHFSVSPREFLDDSLLDFGTNIAKKILHAPAVEIVNSFCSWSDLLGFGTDLSSNDWHPHKDVLLKIASRIKTAHDIVLFHSNPHDRILILNDGAARVFSLNKGESGVARFRCLTYFIKACVQTHMRINGVEHANSLPGCRTVLAFGEFMRYMNSSTHFDDYVLNYTKPDKQGLNTIAKEYDNYQVVYNPTEFQMNTAFSKAFILDDRGSKIELGGAHFFVEQSVIAAIKEYSRIAGFYMEDKLEDNLYQLFVYYDKNKGARIPMGFLFDTPIDVKIEDWKTQVYRLRRFYPDDVPLDENFYFDLDCVN